MLMQSWRSLFGTQQVSRWLRFKLLSRPTPRRQRRGCPTIAFECLEPRLCLSYEPVAYFQPLPIAPLGYIYEGDDLNLDGSGSYSSMDENAPDPGQLHYYWKISGIDVNQDSPTITVPWSDLESTYGWAKGLTVQTKGVTLYVSDNNGNSTTVWHSTSLAANRAPHADAGGVASNASGTPRMEYHFAYLGSVTLDGSGSSDPDMLDSLTYAWDIGDDGSVEAVTSTKTLDWPALWALGLSVGDSLPVKLTVNDGFVDDTFTVYLVYDNTAPNAFAYPIGLGSGYEIYKDESLVLDGSSSHDDDGGPNALTYDWDLNDDGTYDLIDAGATPTVAWGTLAGLGYSTGGTYTVKLRVNDGADSGTDTTTVSVKKPSVSIALTSAMTEHSTNPTHGTITLTRTGPTISGLTVTLSFGGDATMGPQTGSNPDADYGFISNSVTFGTGPTGGSVSIPVVILNDSKVEGPEAISVAIGGGSSDYEVDMTQASASGTITDTDKWRWKTYTGSGGSTSQTYAPATGLWAGSSLTFNASVTATNSSVSASMDAEFIDNGPLGGGAGSTDNINDSWNVNFEFDEVTGVISAGTGEPTPTSQQSGDLAGVCPLKIDYDQTNHTATVTIDKISVIAGGNASITSGIGVVSSTRSWSKELSLSVVILTFGLEIYEEAP